MACSRKALFGLLWLSVVAACSPDEDPPRPPATPTGVTATALSSATIRVTWADASTDETGFRVERSLSQASGFAEVATVTAGVTVCDDAGLAPSTAYHYRITAIGPGGESAPSAVASATTPPGVTPAAPTGVAASALSTSAIRITWTDASSDETGFRIERSLWPTAGFSEVGSVGAGVTSLDDSGLAPRTTYYYRARAYGDGGASEPSQVASATTLTPAPVLASAEPRLAIPGYGIPLVVTGEWLRSGSPASGTGSTLTLVRTRDLDGKAVSGPSLEAAAFVNVAGGVESATASPTVPADAAPGVYDLRLMRSDGQTATFTNALALVPPGTATGVDTGAVCMAAPEPRVGITGTDLLVIDGAKPAVTLTDGLPTWEINAFTAVLDPTPSGCRQVPFERADVRLCTRLEAPLPPAALAKAYDLRVVQPAPASASVSSVRIVVDRPVQLAPFSQARSAVDAPLALTVFDPHLTPGPLRLHVAQAAPPAVLIDGQPAEYATSECSPSGVPGHELCGYLTVTVPQGFPAGLHTITVSSMPGCSGATSFSLGGRPVVESIDPAFTCVRDGNTRVTIRGSGFLRPKVFVGGKEAFLSWSCPTSPTGDTPCDEIAIYGGTALGLPVGIYPLTVENGTYPPVASTTSALLTIAPGPTYVGPPAVTHVYAGIESQVPHPYGGGTVHFAELIPAFGGDPVPVDFAISGTTVTVTVPAGIPENSWRLALHGDSPCVGTNDGWLHTRADPVVWKQDFDAQPGLYVGHEDGTTAQVVHLTSGGNPGGAIAYSSTDGGQGWEFLGGWGWAKHDLGGVRFDLRATGAGAPVSGPGFVIPGPSLTLERDLEPVPGEAWTSYLVPLDDPAGWTRRDTDGTTTPATLEDLRTARDGAWGFGIRGRWTEGAGETALDNFSVELRH